MYVHIHVCHDAKVKITGQLLGVGSLLSSCGPRELNTGCQGWQQVPLPTSPCCWAPFPNFKNMHF